MNKNTVEFETIKSKLQKIQTLAEKGATDGERQAAEQQLQKLLKKYNLTLEQVLEVETDWYMFPYKTSYDRKILFQLVFKVTGKETFNYRRKTKKFWFQLTYAQAVELKAMNAFYNKLWKEELEKFKYAFMWKNGLLVEGNGNRSEGKTLSEEEMLRLCMMAEGITRGQYRKQLGTEQKD